MIRTNHVLVDYENVQPKSLMALVGAGSLRALELTAYPKRVGKR